MTIHAAKGKEFPVVMLPKLDRGGQTDSEPFIDDTFGIGFSPLKPDDGYRKTEPSIIAHMKKTITRKRGCRKETVVLRRYNTRRRPAYFIRNTLRQGEPQQMLKWLDTHLGICDREERFTQSAFQTQRVTTTRRQYFHG